MPKVDFPGIEAYTKMLEELGREAPRLCNRALYEGARVLAEAVQAEIKELDLDPRQIRGLQEGLGIARFWEQNGATVTKIGWEGYNSWRTKRWPSGQPNAMIARAQIRGTSWLRPNRFTARAVRRAREAAVEAMRKRFDADLKTKTD